MTNTASKATQDDSNAEASPLIVAAWIAAISGLFGPSALAKWPTPLYCLVRGDKGKGIVRTFLAGKTAATGAPWAVICIHGKVTRWTKGQAAHRAAYNGGVTRVGDPRSHGCQACKDGKPATLPAMRQALGLDPAPVRKPRAKRATPATVKPSPATVRPSAVREDLDAPVPSA